MVATRDLFIIFGVMLVLIIVVSALGGSLGGGITTSPTSGGASVNSILMPHTMYGGARENFADVKDANAAPGKRGKSKAIAEGKVEGEAGAETDEIADDDDMSMTVPGTADNDGKSKNKSTNKRKAVQDHENMKQGTMLEAFDQGSQTFALI